MAVDSDITLFSELRGGNINAGEVFTVVRQIYFYARFDAAEFGTPHVQWAAMSMLVKMIGQLITDITVARSHLEHVNSGLLGFDSDLAGLTARYTHMYKPAIEQNLDLSNPEQYAVFEKFLEGPIALWDRETCIENWPISVGHCEGPDLLTALSLLHQAGIAEEQERELLESYVTQAVGVYHSLVETAEGIYDDAAARTKEALRTAGTALAEGATAVKEAVGETVNDNFVKPAATTLAVVVGLSATALIGYGVWRAQKTTTQGRIHEHATKGLE